MARPWQWIAQNWPIKIAALFFSVVLWMIVASEETTTQLFPVKLTVELPEGRELTQPLPRVSALVAGSGRDILKLRAAHPEIRKLIPDTLSSSLYALALEPSDVLLPQGANVTVQDLDPREVSIALDQVAHRDVPIVARVTVRPDSGYLIQGGLAVRPRTARLVGLPDALTAIDTVYTVPLELVQVTAPFQRALEIDTSLLGRLRVMPRTVEIGALVVPVSERVFPNVLVRAPGRAFRSYTVDPERVVVTVRGPASRVLALSADSIRVSLQLDGDPADGARAQVIVVPPPGVTARVTPETVTLKSRNPTTPPPARRRG